MTLIQLVQLLATLASVVAAGLLWSTLTRSLRDTDQTAADLLRAKDAQIAALAREALALRELTPIKIRDYLLETRAQLGSYAQALDEACQTAKRAIRQGEADLARSQGEQSARPTERLDALRAATAVLSPRLRALQHQCEFPDELRLRLPRVHPDAVQELTQAYLDLAQWLPLDPAADLRGLSDRILQDCRYRLDENTLFSNVLFTQPPADPGEVWQRPDNGE